MGKHGILYAYWLSFNSFAMRPKLDIHGRMVFIQRQIALYQSAKS